MEITDTFHDKLVHMVSLHSKNQTYELEAKCKQKLFQPDFLRAVKYLRSTGFKEKCHDDTLDIIVDTYRITIRNKDNISRYCKTQDLGKDVNVIQKKIVPNATRLFFDEVQFNIDIRNEIPVKLDVLNDWKQAYKYFRLKKRFSYENEYVRYDMTIVKSCKGTSFSEAISQGFNETFEIEVELVKRSTTDTKATVKKFVAAIIEIYAAINGEDHVLSHSEKTAARQAYLQLAFGSKGTQFLKRATTESLNRPKQYFAGPQPVTLEQKNITEGGLGFVSIQKDYTVTEKADGERMLLFVSADGKVFFINNRLDMKYTGVKLTTISNTLIDGELITRSVTGKSLMMYAVFDIYWDNGKDVRQLPLVSESSKDASRINVMKATTSKMKVALSKYVDIHVKSFEYGDNIFDCCKKILEANTLGSFQYHIDGLILTPKYLPVGASYMKDSAETVGTWNKVFKWKPPQENTIDFLISATKDDFTVLNGVKYRVLELFVGYNPSKWETIDIKNVLRGVEDDRKDVYIKRRFQPGDVLNNETFSQCYMQIANADDKIFCENGDEITDSSIVEFSYDSQQENLAYPLRWKPLRVRKDKTDMYNKHGLSGTANDYGTALNIWQSIRFPVTNDHIVGKLFIGNKDIVQDDVYYYRLTSRDKFASKPMLDFHNYWIKNKSLISKCGSVDPQKGKSLFDVSCGKGGDISKWLEYNFTKVLGVDISRDNIVNPVDGVYARLQQNDKLDKKKHQYVFVPLDSSVKFSQAYFDTLPETDKVVCNHLWGYEKEASLDKYYNFVEEKFDVISCQFSLHYFFESEKKLDNFLWNVNQHIKPGGYFIGTCLDGQRIKSKLKGLSTGSHIQGHKNERIIWHIKKTYENDSTILFGDSIEVYMESIGKLIPEYLVNFDVLKQKLAAYNIELLTPEDAKSMGTSGGVGWFDDAFNACKEYTEENKSIRNSILSMGEDEKTYSFMNMWFIFKKNESSVVKKPLKKLIKAKKALAE